MFIPVVMLDSEAIRTPTSTQRHPLGCRGITKDGRVFRYAKAGTALVAGSLVKSHALTEWQFGSNCPISTDSGTIPITATSIKISSTWSAFTNEGDATSNVAADYFKDGYIVVTKGTTGSGQYLRIKSNTTGTSAAGGRVTFTFREEDKLANTISTANEVEVVLNVYDRVQLTTDEAALTTAFIPVGVAISPVTINYYCWLQTWGPCPVLGAGTVTTGKLVAESTDAGTTGAIAYYGLNASATGLDQLRSLARPPIGTVLVGAVDTEWALVDLHISP